MQTTPYNTGKVLIGVNYKPDNRPFMTVADQQLQDALLSDKRNDQPDNIVVVGCVIAFVAMAAMFVAGWLQ